MITYPEVPTRARADAARDEVRREIATKHQAAATTRPTGLTSLQGFPAGLSPKAHTNRVLQRSTASSISAAAQQDEQPFTLQPSSEEQNMQPVITHQGLERVIQMYALLSLIVRRVGGALAINQKPR